ncbi:MAG: VIT1/CCC1 transporter family protein [Candidatus Woesearchaeota archaeon]
MKDLYAQKSEITEYYVYKLLARTCAKRNRRLLLSIADDELKHYNYWKNKTNIDVKPHHLKVFKYYMYARFLGITYSLKKIIKDEEHELGIYAHLKRPETKWIEEDELLHGKKINALIKKQEDKYAGAMIIGLNDALVEITGAIAGMTFVLRDTKLIAITAGITGFAAALSMAASEYLEAKTEDTTKNPVTAATYTGIAYALTVVLQIIPYLIFDNPLYALLGTVSMVILIIAGFSHYVSVIKNASFKRSFLEMAFVSLGVAILSFILSLLAKTYLIA